MTLAPGLPGVVAPWCDVAAVERDKRVADVELPDGIAWDKPVQAASEWLFKKSGARWSGLRTDTVRPHRLNDDGCDLGGVAYGWGGWGWAAIGGLGNRLFPEGWGPTTLNTNEIQLPGPVTQVVTVMVDGQVLTPGVDYMMYDNRRLVRLPELPNMIYKAWPQCQRLAVPLTEVNTFGITFQWGQAPPVGGELAAHELSIQYGLYLSTKREKLPQRTSKVVRQNVDITIESGDFLSKEGATGYPLVDLFLEAYNPQRLRRRARVYSPDSIVPAISGTSQP